MTALSEATREAMQSALAALIAVRSDCIAGQHGFGTTGAPSGRTQSACDAAINSLENALLAEPNTGEREKALEEAAINDLKSRLDTRLNNWLCEMKPDHDDSIVGFNEAWDIVNKVFKDTRALKSTPKPVGEDVVSALAGMLDIFSGYCCPQVDAAITAMQRIGRDRWSMAYQMKASVFEFDDGETNVKPDETLSKIENTTDGFIVSYWSGRFSKIFPTLEEAVEAHKDNFCRN